MWQCHWTPQQQRTELCCIITTTDNKNGVLSGDIKAYKLAPESVTPYPSPAWGAVGCSFVESSIFAIVSLLLTISYGCTVRFGWLFTFAEPICSLIILSVLNSPAHLFTVPNIANRKNKQTNTYTDTSGKKDYVIRWVHGSLGCIFIKELFLKHPSAISKIMVKHLAIKGQSHSKPGHPSSTLVRSYRIRETPDSLDNWKSVPASSKCKVHHVAQRKNNNDHLTSTV